MKKILALLSAFSMALVLSACGGGGGGAGGAGTGADTPVTLSLGTILSAEDLTTVALEHMAEIAYERSGGSLTIEVFPASQLGNATVQMEAVSLGSQDMFHGSGTWVATYVPDRGAAGMFFVFEDSDHFRAYVQSDLMADVEEQFREIMDIRIISNNWEIAPRSMASTVPIHSIDDIQGLTFRVPDIRAYLDSVNAIGAVPVQIAFGEVYLAMIQGVIQVTEAPFDNLYTMSFYEVGPYIIRTEHIYDNYVVMINERTFNNLSENQQQILTEAANEAGVFFNTELAGMIDTYIELMIQGGATFIEPDATGFTQAVGTAIRELEAAGEWREGLYDEIQALRR